MAALPAGDATEIGEKVFNYLAKDFISKINDFSESGQLVRGSI